MHSAVTPHDTKLTDLRKSMDFSCAMTLFLTSTFQRPIPLPQLHKIGPGGCSVCKRGKPTPKR